MQLQEGLDFPLGGREHGLTAARFYTGGDDPYAIVKDTSGLGHQRL